MGGTMTNKSPIRPARRLSIVIITTLLLLLRPSHGCGGGSLISLFRTVNVTFENQTKHAVDLMCSNSRESEVKSLAPGEMVWWTVEDVVFPLVWCYLQVTEDFFGVFWGFQEKMRCGCHCEWRIKDEGAYYVEEDGTIQYQWLYKGASGFV